MIPNIKNNLGNPANKLWRAGLLISVIALLTGIFCTYKILTTGLGILDINNYINWGILITSFVFWIGISHAGTFISAILLLLNQDWRRTISRPAEAMTIIAIVIAGFMPILHLGKPGLFYQVFPFPNRTTFYLTNFNSPLSWDFMAITTYLVVSILFFHIGLMPDLGKLRDRANHKISRYLYHFFSFGWTGSASAWANHTKMMFIMAGLITPLVISVHSIVSFDFAVTLRPGWHSGIFPIYFVIGAIFSGFAMISLIITIARKMLKLNEHISIDHIENMNKIILFTATLLLYIFMSEIFIHWYAGKTLITASPLKPLSGHMGWLYLIMITTTLILPQLLWNKKIRRSSKKTLFISLFILAGMFLERFFIVIGGAEKFHLTSGFVHYKSSLYAIGIFTGNAGLFVLMFLLLFRYIPFIVQYEIKKNII